MKSLFQPWCRPVWWTLVWWKQKIDHDILYHFNGEFGTRCSMCGTSGPLYIYIYIYRIYVDLHISIHGAFRTFDVINLVSFLYLDPVIYFCRT